MTILKTCGVLALIGLGLVLLCVGQVWAGVAVCNLAGMVLVLSDHSDEDDEDGDEV